MRITCIFFFSFYLRYIYSCTLGLVTIIDIHCTYFLYMLMYVTYMCCFFSLFMHMLLILVCNLLFLFHTKMP